MLSLLPKPSRFLFLISLKTGCGVVCLFAILNKASGLYGMLALLTGAHVSAWQMSMYVYSLLATGLFLQCMRYIAATGPRSCLASRGVSPVGTRSRLSSGGNDGADNGGVMATLTSPSSVATDSLLGVVLFAWLYLVDSIVNGVYTALFATSWFLVLSHDLSSASSTGVGSGRNGTQNGLPGAGMLGENAGFTKPTYTVPAVVVAATPLPGGGMQAGMSGVPANSSAAAAIAGAGYGADYAGARSAFGALLAPEQLPSVLALAAILLLKSYFVLVAFGYAARCVEFVESASISSSSSSASGSAGGGGGGGGSALMGGSAALHSSSHHSTDAITAEPYQNAGWRAALYRALTRGKYWRATDLRLSKARSSGRE